MRNNLVSGLLSGPFMVPDRRPLRVERSSCFSKEYGGHLSWLNSVFNLCVSFLV